MSIRQEGEGAEEQAVILVQRLEYYQKFGLLPKSRYVLMEQLNEPPHQVVCDYIAGMTDRYAVAKFKELMIPSAWSIY